MKLQIDMPDFLREATRKSEVLPAERLAALAKKARAGDKAATEAIVLGNLRLVHRVALKWRWSGVDYSDLCAEGLTGLLDAIRTWRSGRGASFCTIAHYWITAKISRRCLRDASLVTRGRAVSDGRYREPLHDISLDRCIAHVDGAGATFLDYARAENDTEAETEAAESAGRAKALIRGFVSTLRDPRDVAIVRLRLLGDPPATLEEIGRQFGVSRERIRQMQARVLERLKSYALARKDRDLAPLPRRPPVAPTPRPPRVWQTPYCTESDCERPSWARNLCVGHYKQWWIARRKVA